MLAVEAYHQFKYITWDSKTFPFHFLSFFLEQDTHFIWYSYTPSLYFYLKKHSNSGHTVSHENHEDQFTLIIHGSITFKTRNNWESLLNQINILENWVSASFFSRFFINTPYKKNNGFFLHFIFPSHLPVHIFLLCLINVFLPSTIWVLSTFGLPSVTASSRRLASISYT